jgi:hypothetical protein
MDNANFQRCAHENCTCPAAPESRYGSSACETEKGSESACGCGHSQCAGAKAAA